MSGNPSDEPSAGSSSTATTLPPVDVLVYKNGRLLDTVFISKGRKKPRWITSTVGSVTTLYSVSKDGLLRQSACINWPNNGSRDASKATTTVEIDGETVPAERFGRKRNGGPMGGKETHELEINNLRCLWSARFIDYGHKTMSPQAGMNFVQWECTAEVPTLPTSPAPGTSSSRPSTASSRIKALFKSSHKEEARTLLATLQLYGGTHTRRELGLYLYADGKPYSFQLLLSAILLGSEKDDWKRMQSKATYQELEAMISSDAAGALPAYSPIREERDRDTRAELHPTVPAVSPWRWASKEQRDAARHHNHTSIG